MLPPDYIDDDTDVQSEAPASLALAREGVEIRGMVVSKADPFACVPTFDADPEELAYGPPDDPAELALGAPRLPTELREGPWSLLLATALRGATPAQAPLVEDALLRRSDAALSEQDVVRLRPLADQVALLETEYLSASTKYHEAEDTGPRPEDWKNPQHLLEAMKVHERRMDRLQRGMRDAHERLIRAVQLLERARGGDDLGGAPLGAPSGGKPVVGVEVTQTGAGTSRVRVGSR